LKKLVRFNDHDGNKIKKSWLEFQAKSGERMSFNEWITTMLLRVVDCRSCNKPIVDDDPDIPFV